MNSLTVGESGAASWLQKHVTMLLHSLYFDVFLMNANQHRLVQQLFSRRCISYTSLDERAVPTSKSIWTGNARPSSWLDGWVDCVLAANKARTPLDVSLLHVLDTDGGRCSWCHLKHENTLAEVEDRYSLTYCTLLMKNNEDDLFVIQTFG